jgi:hypothetical protein
VATEECPKSFITPESIEYLEKFFARKTWRGGSATDLAAREADAFVTLEQELRREVAHGGE